MKGTGEIKVKFAVCLLRSITNQVQPQIRAASTVRATITVPYVATWYANKVQDTSSLRLVIKGRRFPLVEVLVVSAWDDEQPSPCQVKI
jgi:hypothetical protein